MTGDMTDKDRLEPAHGPLGPLPDMQWIESLVTMNARPPGIRRVCYRNAVDDEAECAEDEPEVDHKAHDVVWLGKDDMFPHLG